MWRLGEKFHKGNSGKGYPMPSEAIKDLPTRQAQQIDAPALRKEIAKALGVEHRPSMEELHEAFVDGARVLADLQRKRQIEDKSAELLWGALTALFVAALVAQKTEWLVSTNPSAPLRRWLAETATR